MTVLLTVEGITKALDVTVQGTSIQAALDGKHLLDHAWTEPIEGKVGVWSKTDSVSYFDDFTMTWAK